MNTVLHAGFVVLTPWKLVGYVGALMFAGRWFVQLWYSRRHGRPVVPRAFWYMSIAGSVLLLAYFTFGKNDSVGILSNAFPFAIALYNLRLDVRNRARSGRVAQSSGEEPEAAVAGSRRP